MTENRSNTRQHQIPFWYRFGLVFGASLCTAGHMATIEDGPVSAVISTVFVMTVVALGARAIFERTPLVGNELHAVGQAGGDNQEALARALLRLLTACLVATATGLAAMFGVRAATDLEWVWAAASGCVVFIPSLLVVLLWLEARERGRGSFTATPLG